MSRFCKASGRKGHTPIPRSGPLSPLGPCRPSSPYRPCNIPMRENHASKITHATLCTLRFAFTKPAWYRAFLHRTAKPNFFLQSTFAPVCHTKRNAPSQHSPFRIRVHWCPFVVLASNPIPAGQSTFFRRKPLQ